MSTKLDRNNAKPLYIQLEEKLRAELEDGIWKPNQRFPSENELNQTYGLSRMTVRAVVNQLVNEGLLYRVQGKGTYIADSKISARSPAYKGIREQLEEMGYETHIEVKKAERITPSHSLQIKLQLSPIEDVYVIERLRVVQNAPISIHTSFIPCKFAPDLLQYLNATEPLSATLENNFNLKMSYLEETLETVSATMHEAEILGIKKGYNLILLEEIISDENKTPYEFAKILFRGDRIKLRFEYHA